MTRFIAVQHSWFVHSRGFKVHNLEATTREEADKEVGLIFHNSQEDFKNTAIKLIELKVGEQLPKRLNVKLTLWERITGTVQRKLSDPSVAGK